jgi:hypothetical protein
VLLLLPADSPVAQQNLCKLLRTRAGRTHILRLSVRSYTLPLLYVLGQTIPYIATLPRHACRAYTARLLFPRLYMEACKRDLQNAAASKHTRIRPVVEIRPQLGQPGGEECKFPRSGLYDLADWHKSKSRADVDLAVRRRGRLKCDVIGRAVSASQSSPSGERTRAPNDTKNNRGQGSSLRLLLEWLLWRAVQIPAPEAVPTPSSLRR